MNWIIPLLAGLILGWLAELLIDYFFWRKRRICTGAEDQLKDTLHEVELANANLKTQIAELTENARRVPVLESELRSKEQVLEEAEERAIKLRAEVTELREQLAHVPALESRLKSTQSALEDAETQTAKFRLQVTELTGRLEEVPRLETELQAKERALTDSETTTDTLRAQVAELMENVQRLPELEAELQAKQRALADSEATVTSLRTQIAELSERLERMATLESELLSRQRALVDAEAMVASLQAQVAELTDKLERLPRLEAELRSKETTLTSMVSRLREQETELERQRESNAQLTALEAMLQQQGNEIARLTTELSTVTRFAYTTDRLQAPLPPTGGAGGVMAAHANAHLQTAASMAVTEQNLQRISGISSKIQFLLYLKGITNFAQLANASEAQLSDVLERAARYTSLSARELHQIWVEEARLVLAGNHQQLQMRQRQLRQQTRRDYLQRIWGIGPKEANALRMHGIETFEQLAALDAAKIATMVDTSHVHNGLSGDALYTIWSQLAQLASQSAWDEFEARERELQASYASGRDDLQQIRGIGPQLDRVLREQGINSFEELARIDTVRLGELLQAAGLPAHLLGQQLQRSWAEQAQLAADGDWEALEALQFEFGWWNNLEALPR